MANIVEPDEFSPEDVEIISSIGRHYRSLPVLRVRMQYSVPGLRAGP